MQTSSTIGTTTNQTATLAPNTPSKDLTINNTKLRYVIIHKNGKSELIQRTLTLFERILAYFGFGPAAFKNIVQFIVTDQNGSSEDLLEATANLRKKIITYNQTHSRLKQVTLTAEKVLTLFPLCKILFSSSIREDATLKQMCVRFQSNTNSYLMSFVAKDDITKNHGEVPDAFVNAANATISHGEGGTNQAFSELIDKSYWDAQADQYFTSNPRKERKLTTSECAEMGWPNKAKKFIGKQPRYLLHTLGPIVKKDALLENAEQVYQAYFNTFKKCQELHIKSVQLPLLSCGIYANNLNAATKNIWQQIVERALVLAAKKATEQKLIDDFTVVTNDTFLCTYELQESIND